MIGVTRVLAVGLTTLLFCTSSAMSQYWYYNMDGSQIPVQVFDDLVSVSLDSVDVATGLAIPTESGVCDPALRTLVEPKST